MTDRPDAQPGFAPLVAHLQRRIAAEGPLTVAAFMAEALGHPRYGYYMTRDPFGAAGDFTTAPEISQMFGELLGLWCAHTWSQMGAPDPVLLVELGPGRGTLMADALRAAALVPAFRQALRVHLVETSPVLRARQAETLAAAEPVWHADLSSVPEAPLLVLANEMFDALPIRQFQRTAHGWMERRVDIDPAAPAEDAAFRFVLVPDPAAALLVPPALRTALEGSIVEICPVGQQIVRDLAQRIARAGGAALIIDYGYARSAPGDTLQAVRRHQPAPVLADPGEADLTAHVDFEALASAARAGGARVFGPVPQGDFLVRLGVRERAAMLRRRATPAQARDIDAALTRLIDPAEMGTLFKVLALTDPRQEPPVGFET